MTRTHIFERLSGRAALVALLLVVAASAQTFAQSPGQDEQPPPPAGQGARRRAADGDRRLMRALNLTPEQRAEIARIRRETEQQSRAVVQRIRRARRALEETIYSPAVDEAAVEERARAVAAAEAERVRLRAQTELRIRRLLTPEQLAVFRELRQRAAQRALRRQGLQPSRADRTRRDARRPPP